MDQALHEAVEALYVTFPVGPLDFIPAGCTYCHAPEDYAGWALPTRQVPAELLAAFAAEGEDHLDRFDVLWRHLFPAVAGALAGDALHVDEGLVLARVAQAGFKEWPFAEQQAALTFLIRWFEHLVVREPVPGGPALIDLLQGASWLTGEIDSWLGLWNQHRETANAAHTLVLFYETWDVLRGETDEIVAGWGEWPDGSASSLRAWAAQDWVAAQLRDATLPDSSLLTGARETLVHIAPAP